MEHRPSQLALMVKNLPAHAGDLRDADSTPASGGSPGGEYGNPLQYSCLENPTDTGAWGLQSIGSERVWQNSSRTQLSSGIMEYNLSKTQIAMLNI